MRSRRAKYQRKETCTEITEDSPRIFLLASHVCRGTAERNKELPERRRGNSLWNLLRARNCLCSHKGKKKAMNTWDIE